MTSYERIAQDDKEGRGGLTDGGHSFIFRGEGKWMGFSRELADSERFHGSRVGMQMRVGQARERRQTKGLYTLNGEQNCWFPLQYRFPVTYG